jgi:hypothetical protein
VGGGGCGARLDLPILGIGDGCPGGREPAGTKNVGDS